VFSLSHFISRDSRFPSSHLFPFAHLSSSLDFNMSPLPAAKQSASSAQHPNPTSQVSVDPIVPCPHPSSSSGSVAETSSASVPVIEAARTSPTVSPFMPLASPIFSSPGLTALAQCPVFWENHPGCT